MATSLDSLILSAQELKVLTNWPDSMIEDYLNIFRNLVNLSGDISGLEEQVAQNVIDIAANAVQIAINAANIATNAADIVTLDNYKLPVNENEPATVTGWDDALVTIGAFKNVGSGIPAFEQVGASVFWGDAYTDEGAAPSEKREYMSTQVSHGIKRGSQIRFHIHYCIENSPALDENVRWSILYGTLNKSGDLAPAGTAVNVDMAVLAASPTNSYHITSLVAIIDANIIESSMFAVQLRRNSSDAADTYSGEKIYLLSADGHIEKAKAGTENEIPT